MEVRHSPYFTNFPKSTLVQQILKICFFEKAEGDVTILGKITE